jgi:protoporphyrinogen oxidase
MKKKVIIVGGGVSGLSTAFFLREKYKNNIDIHLFEKHNCLGGYARTPKYDGYYHEHSPRVIAIQYTYFWKIINKVEEIKKHVKKSYHTEDIGFSPKIGDLLRLLGVIMYYVVSKKKTNKYFKEIIPFFHEDTQQFIDIYLHKLGKDHNDLSFDLVVNLCRIFLRNALKLTVFHFDGPFEETFVKPLLDHIQIHVYTNHTVNYIHYTEKVEYIVVNHRVVKADDYILAVDVTSLDEFINVSKLKVNSYGIQMGCLLVFKKRWPLSQHFITLNTEWMPIIQLRENCWSMGLHHSEWSINLPNLYTNKNSISTMDKAQILKQLIFQINQYFPFVTQNDVEYFQIWEAFKKDKEWRTYEPYFVDFIGIEKEKTEIKSKYPNLYIVNGFSKEVEYPIWYKEAAAECGYKCSMLV